MISPLTKRARGTRRRGNNVTRPQPTTPIAVSSATKNTTKITLTFDQAVILSGTPDCTTDLPGVTALSATQTAPDTVEITFSASVATATEVRIPYEEPGIRNASGGFVYTSTFPVT
jgi:hypothetical protein